MKITSLITWGVVFVAPTDFVNVSANSASIVRQGCGETCTAIISDPTQLFLCQYVCASLEAQAGEPCIQAFSNSTDEHLALLSYSSGHYLETVGILAGAALQQNSEELAFVQDLHLNDRGSPAGCHAIDDAHYCILEVEPAVFLGLCVPEACDSASLIRILGNLLPPLPTSLPSVDVVCGDESHVDAEAGMYLVLVLAGSLGMLTIMGTVLDGNQNPRVDVHAKNHSPTDRMRSLYSGDADEPAKTPVEEGLLAASKSPEEHDIEEHEDQHQTRLVASDTSLEATGTAGYGLKRKGHESSGTISIPDGELHAEHQASGILGSSEDTMRDPLLGTASPALGLQRPSALQGLLSAGGMQEDVPSWWIHCLRCFSLRNNLSKLLTPLRSSHSFGALDGIRTLSNVWIMIFHAMLIQLDSGGGMSNMGDVLPIDGHGVLARFSAQIILGGVFAADTFFLMSGFLASVLLLPSLEMRSQHVGYWILGRYWHRYTRLAPTIIFMMLLSWQVLPRTSDGPAWWPFASSIKEACRKHWWTEIVFVQNFVPWPPEVASCIPLGWWLGAEMQLFLVAVPFLVLYQYRPRAGAITLFSILVASCISTLCFGFYEDVRFPVLYSISLSKFGVVTQYPWARCPPYIIGMLCGMAWHAYGRGGVTGRRGLGSTAGAVGDHPLIAQERVFVTVGFVTSALMMLLPVYGAYWANRDVQEVQIPAWADHLYLALSRPCWASGVALLCGLCFLGRGGVVNTILASPFWTSLSQLTFCSYLIHLPLMAWLYHSRSIPYRFTSLEYTIAFLGFAVGSFALSTVMYLVVEAPFRNLASWSRRRDGTKEPRQ